MEALGINLGYLVVQIFNFLFMLVLLSALAYRPVLNMLKERKERIAQGLEDARVASEARENAEEEAEKILSKAQQEASEILREANQRAERTAEEIREAAAREAQERRETAIIEGEQAKERMLGELRGQVASLAIAAAQKVIGEALDEKRQRILIESFFSGIKQGRVEVLVGEEISGKSAMVTSAVPLTDAEKVVIREDILDQLGASASISFRVDPNILGGVVIKVGDKVIDGSVSGKLGALRETLA